MARSARAAEAGTLRCRPYPSLGPFASTDRVAWCARVDTEVDPYQWHGSCMAGWNAAAVFALGRDKLGSPTRSLHGGQAAAVAVSMGGAG